MASGALQDFLESFRGYPLFHVPGVGLPWYGEATCRLRRQEEGVGIESCLNGKGGEWWLVHLQDVRTEARIVLDISEYRGVIQVYVCGVMDLAAIGDLLFRPKWLQTDREVTVDGVPGYVWINWNWKNPLNSESTWTVQMVVPPDPSQEPTLYIGRVLTGDQKIGFMGR